MFSHGPSTKRERETLLLLRKALPEYEINPHMRLANVVKGRLSYISAMGQYELDFVVQDKSNGNVVCAIELDDPTHDTEDGKRRDGNKNRWMEQARIKLIRIREPQEALEIRELIDQPADFIGCDEFLSSPQKASPLQRYALSIVAAVALAYVLFLAMNHVIQNSMLHQQQQVLKATQATSSVSQSSHGNKPASVQPQQAPAPHYERRFVYGKSARECAKIGNTFDSEALQCMSDHYEMIEVH